MNYEEKYREALQAVNELKQINPSDDGVQKWADKYFPELKESEDEKLKEQVVYAINQLHVCECTKNKLIAWLEKQGEQTPADKAEPKFKVGDWVINKKGIIDQITDVIENVTNHTYGYDTINGEYFNDYTEGVRLWTIEDAKDGDVLVDGELPFIFKKIDSMQHSYAYCGINSDSNFRTETEGKSGEWTWMQDIKPAAKEQRDLLFQKMKEAGYTWDAEKRELRKVEQKFKVGDWIISNVSHEDYRICKILKAENGEYVIESIYGYKGYNNFETFDKDYHLWTIQDAKDGDIIQLSGITAIFKSQIYDSSCKCHCTVYKGKFKTYEEDENYETYGIYNAKPATKEQRDLLFKKMKEAGYEWDAEKKELKKMEQYNITGIGSKHAEGKLAEKIKEMEQSKQNSAWSENDEKILNMIISDYIAASKSFCGYQGKLDWLKLIKERVQSQPKQEWKQENTDDLTDFENAMMHIGGSFFSQHAGLDPNDTNAIKEQANLLLELVPKQEWSEEEQQIIEDAACIILDCVNIAETEKEEKRLEELADKLQDLKPQDTWKPSDEQMQALELIVHFHTFANRDAKENMKALFNDLKKLREG